jgi:hypothetical protein
MRIKWPDGTIEEVAKEEFIKLAGPEPSNCHEEK